MLKRSCFKIADLTETDSRLCNPNRGFYQMFRMRLDETADYEAFDKCLVKEETLVLLMVEIAGHSKQPLKEEALASLGDTIAFFSARGKRLIVRATYDIEGKANDVEPDDFELIKTHLKQVLLTLSKYEKDIFVYQGLLVGNWGEMHSSKYLTRHHLTELGAVADEYLPKKVFLAVRKPAQYRMLRTHLSERPVLGECQIGLFNDAILASKSDLGTYGDSDTSRYEGAWSREKELEFINKLCTNVPIGGESVLGDGYVKTMQPQAIIDCFATMHVTYINRLYDMQMLDYFKSIPMKKGAFKGKSLYDYIDAHLGYRFVIRNAKITVESNEQTAEEQLYCQLEIENTGFANAYDEIELSLLIAGQQCKKAIVIGELQSLCGGAGKCFKVALGRFNKNINDKTELYAVAKHVQSNTSVSFANIMTEDGVFLGTLSNYQF